MPRSSTTFTKETAPKGKGGSKHRRTKYKEMLGIDGFEKVGNYLQGEEMAAKVVNVLSSLQGKELLDAVNMLMEYFKPKLSRTELSGKDGKDLVVTFREVEDDPN